MSHMKQDPPTSEQLGYELKAQIKAKGYTQEQLSNHVAIPRNSLNRKLNSGVFTYTELAKISQVLGTPLSVIMRRAEEDTEEVSNE